jgi:NTE family protein
MRVGLVLGAGGVMGASWLVGALEALAAQTGWDPRDAEVIVGTSAGSVVGSMCADGLPVSAMSAVLRGDTAEITEIEALHHRSIPADTGTEYRLARALPPIGPGSWRMALSTLRHPGRHAPLAVLSGWLPRGVVRTDAIHRLVERLVRDPWPDHPNYWAVACDYHSGRRTAFGREGAPIAHVADAVSASCAIPGFYHPVTIEGRRYIDGGVCSPSNLDLLRGRGLDLVLCLNPMSSRVRPTGHGPGDLVASLMRENSGRRLGHEARKLRAEGTEVLLVQPVAKDLEVMGVNLMARGRRAEMVDCARATTGEQLSSLIAAGVRLPGRYAAPAPRGVAPSARPATGLAA